MQKILLEAEIKQRMPAREVSYTTKRIVILKNRWKVTFLGRQNMRGEGKKQDRMNRKPYTFCILTWNL